MTAQFAFAFAFAFARTACIPSWRSLGGAA